jgi:D-alanyl-D-alanine carboxypeptidase
LSRFVARAAVVAALVGALGAPALPAGASLPPVAYAPPAAPPAVGAAAWLVYDEGTDTILASLNATEARPMASVTKLMSALVAVRSADPAEIVTISTSAATTGEAEIGIVAGETWTLRDLLAAMLVRSGNDAAVAVAEHVGGSVDGFAAMMNEMADIIGLENSSFTNPHGLDEDDHFTTAADLLLLGRRALEDPLIARLVRTRVVRFRETPDGNSRRAVNTNVLLGSYPGVAGVKTGFTGRAGRVLITVADKGDRRLWTVVMGAADHFDDTSRLLEYGFSAFGPSDIMRAGGFEEGGGGTVLADVEPWLAVRLAATPELDDGRWAMSLPGSTPAEQVLEAELRELLPGVLGGDG